MNEYNTIFNIITNILRKNKFKVIINILKKTLILESLGMFFKHYRHDSCPNKIDNHRHYTD